ncbi:MAG: DUF1801 domain-containing protein, partial [Phenylobacterium sp.]
MKTQASSPPPASVDGYIERCKPEVQAVLRDIRAVIRRAAPEATERLSYNMPTFFMGRVLIHY